MSSSFTPGPWTWLRNEYAATELRGCYIRGGGHELAMVEARPIRDQAVCEANARLIAAAPELLRACEQAVEWLEGWASAEPYIGVLRAAIAKATGSAA